MKKNVIRSIVCLLLIFIFSNVLFAKNKVEIKSGKDDGQFNTSGAIVNTKINIGSKRDQVLSNLIKSALENYHYLKRTVDNKASAEAFMEYFKKTDYGKQFFIQSDIKKLEKFKYKIDDELIVGKLNFINELAKIFKNRVLQVDKFRKEIFTKGFNFKKKEMLELDTEKRKYHKSLLALKDHWRKNFKHSVMVRIQSDLDEQSGEDDEKSKSKKDLKKKKKKKKVIKILSLAEIKKNAIDSVSKKYKRLFSRLLTEDNEDYLERFFNSVCTVFDPHTSYMPPRRKEDFDIEISGSLEGIGAVLSEDAAFIKVVEIVPGGAAWRGKELEVGDLILAVAQAEGKVVDLEDMRVDDAVRYIRGKKGTEVRLTVKKLDGTRKIISIIRAKIQIGAAFAKSSVLQMKADKMKVGYIQLPKFYRNFENKKARNCSDDVKKEIRSFKDKNISALILDLRNNGGGALEDSKQMSGLFIKKGPIVQVKDYAGKIDILKDKDKSVEYSGPLIILVNRLSASASEILAAAMQDYGRAVIVGGEFTHGKGTVQAIFPLNQGPLMSLFGSTMGAIKMTVQKFYRVNGGCTQEKGVTPDIIVPDPYSYAKNREGDLEYALKWDKIKKLKFTPWDGPKFDFNQLRLKSKKRVGQSKDFKKVVDSIAYLTKRRDDTNVTLNLSDFIKENKKNKKVIKKLKLVNPNKNLIITDYESSLLSSIKIQEEDKKHWDEDFTRKRDDWIEALQEDIVLNETLNIAYDMVNMVNKHD